MYDEVHFPWRANRILLHITAPIRACLRNDSFFSVYSEGHFYLERNLALALYRGFYKGHISEKFRSFSVYMKGIFLGEQMSFSALSPLL